MNIKELLKDRFSPEELKELNRAYDIIGDVAIIEVPERLENREREIAEAILSSHKHVKTICKKMSERRGRYRLRELKVLYGTDTYTEHREHGMVLRLDVQKAYFSPREATERQRIAKQVRPGETVMVMFSGICPYAIAVAKQQPVVKKVYAIEINEHAHRYAEENVRINKLSHKVVPVLGDVEKEAPDFFGVCDRVIMPLPLEAHRFLPLAIKCLKKSGGTIHYYTVADEKDIDKSRGSVERECEKLGKKCAVLKVKRVLLYGPRTWKVCVDFRVS